MAGQKLSFNEYLQKRFSPAVGRDVVPTLLHKFNLPEPEDGYVELDNGALVPIDDYGLVLRVENTEFKPWDFVSPHVLQPLIFFRIDHDLQATLSPGTNSIGILEDDYEKIQHALLKTFYFCNADRVDDCGYIGKSTSRFPHGFPVILDTNDLIDLRKAKEVVRQAGVVLDAEPIPEETQPDRWYQTRLYQKLITLGHQILTMDDDKSRDRLARSFWQQCHQSCTREIQEGVCRLRASWQTAGAEKTKDRPVAAAGIAYHRTLQTDSFHCAVLG